VKALNDVEDLGIKLVIGNRPCSSNFAVTVVLLNDHCDETRSIVSRKVLAQRCMLTPETGTDIQIESIGHCVYFVWLLKCSFLEPQNHKLSPTKSIDDTSYSNLQNQFEV